LWSSCLSLRSSWVTGRHHSLAFYPLFFFSTGELNPGSGTCLASALPPSCFFALFHWLGTQMQCLTCHENRNLVLFLPLMEKTFNISWIMVLAVGSCCPFSDWGSSILLLICLNRRTYAKLWCYRRVQNFQNNSMTWRGMAKHEHV
jgi:hypothetical protein